MTGTLINVGAVLVGTTIGVLIGHGLPAGIQQRVLLGLGMVTLVLGIDNALEWDVTNPLIVMGAVLLRLSFPLLLLIPAVLCARADAAWRRNDPNKVACTRKAHSTVLPFLAFVAVLSAASTLPQWWPLGGWGEIGPRLPYADGPPACERQHSPTDRSLQPHGW